MDISESNIVDSFETIEKKLYLSNLTTLKKRHLYYIWKKYDTQKYMLFSDYYLDYHKFLMDFSDMNYFIFHNIKKTYDILCLNKNISEINEYIYIITGMSDDLINQSLNSILQDPDTICCCFHLYKPSNTF